MATYVASSCCTQVILELTDSGEDVEEALHSTVMLYTLLTSK